MAEFEMSITRSRMFFDNGLPGAILQHRSSMYGKVVGTNSDEEKVKRINQDLLGEVVEEHLLHWSSLGGEVDSALQTAIRTNRIVVRSPTSIFLSPFPLTLLCSSCKVVQIEDYGTLDERIKHLAKWLRPDKGRREKLRCKECNGALHQVKYVQVHRCGGLEQLLVPLFSMKRQKLIFQDGGTFLDSYWLYSHSKQVATRSYPQKCSICQGQQGKEEKEEGVTPIKMRGVTLTSGRNASFYPQLIQYISLSKKTTALIRHFREASEGGNDFGQAILCGLLGIQGQEEIRENIDRFLHGKEETLSSPAKLQKDKEDLEASIQKMESQSLPQVAIEALRMSLKKKQSEIEFAEGFFSKVEEWFFSPHLYAAIRQQRRVFEAALFSGENFGRRSLQEEIEGTLNSQEKSKKKKEKQILKEQFGVREVIHFDNVSVVMAAIGFSRELPTPDRGQVPVRLNAFQDEISDNMAGKTPVYAVNVRTEGILIRLDPCRMFDWAVKNLGWEASSSQIMGDSRRAHARILEKAPELLCYPQNSENPVIGQDVQSILGVLHSVSHVLMYSAKNGSGYDERSLTEYLFPSDLSVLIYVTSTQDYTMGGLLSLFQHNLKQWFELSSKKAMNCLFDPLCSEQGGSCHGCLQTPIGCETFNRGISRAYLHGGITREEGENNDVERNIEYGYWSS